MSDQPAGYATVLVDDVIKFSENYLESRKERIEEKIKREREEHNKKLYSRFFEFDENESRFGAELTGCYWSAMVEEVSDAAKILKLKNIETMLLSTEVLSCIYRFEKPSSNTVD